MNNSRKIAILASTVALAAMISAPAQAGGKNRFCKQYAKQAVSQFYEAKREQCGFAGAYWHPFKSAHKAWCMGVSRRVAGRGNEHRIDMLNRCEGIEEGD